MVKKKEGKKPVKFRCKKCYSAQTYVNKDGTRVCRKCNFREKGDKK